MALARAFFLTFVRRQASIIFSVIPSVLLLLSLGYILTMSQRGPQLDTAAQSVDSALVKTMLDRYSFLARNMTVRIQTAEEALIRVRKRQDIVLRKKKVQRFVSPSEATGKIDQGASQESSGGDSEDETDEERGQRMEDEEKEQLQLIGFNPADKSYRRFRPDFKCGVQTPSLPDGDVVECNANSEAPCCSGLGWCGKSKAHCSCETCVNYAAHLKFRLGKVEILHAQRECDTISHDLGPFKTPEECAKKLVDDIDCGRMFMISKNYPEWGCRCCTMQSQPAAEVKPEWSIYTAELIPENGPFR